MVRNPDHVTIAVADGAAAIRFFALLGFREQHVATIDGGLPARCMGMPDIARMVFRFTLLIVATCLFGAPARADDVGCTSTTFHLFSPNDKVCVQAFDDPRVPGVTCHISQAKTGGWKGAVGVAEDPSRFSIACHQTGPITLPDGLPREESVFSESTSLVFKNTKVVRMYDARRNTLVYVAVSKRVLEGSPMNALSAVPVMPWAGR